MSGRAQFENLSLATFWEFDLAEKENRKGKRFQNTQNTPETRNVSRGGIEQVNLKSPHTMNDTKKSEH